MSGEILEFGEILDFAAVEPQGHRLREYQVNCLDAIREGWKTYSRLLAVLATGGGKTIIFSHVTREIVAAGGKVLILAHTDELLEQAIDKLYRTTGLEADKEKADSHASPSASVVVGSIQTLSRINRLTGFADDHFALVICDETHRALAPIYQRVLRYFHFGAESLADEWVPPEPGVPYQHKARVLGVTATADRGDRRSLGEFYQHCCFDFGLLEACRDGYLVRPVVKNIPLKIDLKRHSKEEVITRGGDYSAEFIVQRITPFLRAIAGEIAKNSRDRKTVCFLPSIETSRLLAEALCEHGIAADFVSGACDDRDEKIARFDAAPNGSAITCAMLLTEGWDCPTASCICVLRPTKIRALFAQCIGRGTRTLPGVIDGLETREERLAAIAASDKKDLLIIDFLWLPDSLGLIKPVDLVATKPGVKERMEAAQEAGATDLLDMEMSADRDLLKSLEQAVKKNARREARVIDPIALGMGLGDAKLASWQPTTRWDSDLPTDGQLNFLRTEGIDVTKIKFKGLASEVISLLTERMKHKLASPRQLEFMKQLGVPEEKAALLTMAEATRTIDTVKREKEARRATSASSDPASAPASLAQ